MNVKGFLSASLSIDLRTALLYTLILTSWYLFCYLILQDQSTQRSDGVSWLPFSF